MKDTPSKLKPAKVAGRNETYSRGVPQSFVDRDLTKVNPLREQFEPTDAEPVRQHNKMAGGC